MSLDIDVKPNHSVPIEASQSFSEGSSPVTRRHVIRLIPEALNLGDQNLEGFVKVARHLVSQADPSLAARYGGILYLALICAFETAGMTKLDWAPALTLEVQSEDYEKYRFAPPVGYDLTPTDTAVCACPLFIPRPRHIGTPAFKEKSW